MIRRLAVAMTVAAALSLLVAAPASAHGAPRPTPPTQDRVSVSWLLPEGAVPQGNTIDESGFPQTLLTGDVPCGRWVQVDVYYADEAPLFTADGVLTYGEDWANSNGHRGVVSWSFVYGGDCPTPTPTPEPTPAPTPSVTPTPEPTVTPTPEPSSAPTPAPKLADTGVDDTTLFLTGMGALLAVVIGVIIAATIRTAKRRLK